MAVDNTHARALKLRTLLLKEEASEVKFRSTTRRTKNLRQEGEKAAGTLISQTDVTRLPKAPRKQKSFGGPRRPRERIPLQIPSRWPLLAHRNFNKSIQLFCQ